MEAVCAPKFGGLPSTRRETSDFVNKVRMGSAEGTETYLRDESKVTSLKSGPIDMVTPWMKKEESRSASYW